MLKEKKPNPDVKSPFIQKEFYKRIVIAHTVGNSAIKDTEGIEEVIKNSVSEWERSTEHIESFRFINVETTVIPSSGVAPSAQSLLTIVHIAYKVA